MNEALNGVAALSHLGVIAVQGDDAASFLQGQLTQDFALLDDSHARLAAFCNAKGRMQASFVGFRGGAGEILLVTSRDILAPTLKRLSMFVLRAKARLRDASGEYAVFGLLGSAGAAWSSGLARPWQKQVLGQAQVVSLYPALGTWRGLWVAPAGEPSPAGAALPLAVWQWSEVRSGVATVSAAVVEAFVPQMLNYESVGGVSFKKGCYPGQEVVARSQFRGTLKRRAFVARAAGELSAGQEVFHDADASQPAGLVVQAAPAPDGGWEAIVSLQTAAAQGGRLDAGGPGTNLLELLPLPYLLMADV